MDEKVILNKFLKKGTIIRTRHCNSKNWVTNLVYSLNEDTIEIDIGLEKEYIDNYIMSGDTMRCKFNVDNYEFILMGWVSRIRLDYPQSITIKIHNIQKFENERKSYRYDVYLGSVIKKDKSGEDGIFAIIINMSNGGAAFIVKEELESNFNNSDLNDEQKVYYFDIFVSSSEKICFLGCIKRKCNSEKGIEYGVEIVDIDIDNEKELNRFINELERKDNELYSNRKSFWSKHSKYNK